MCLSSAARGSLAGLAFGFLDGLADFLLARGFVDADSDVVEGAVLALDE